MGCQQSLAEVTAYFDDEDTDTKIINPTGPQKPDHIPNRAVRRKEINTYLSKYRDEEKALTRNKLGNFRDIQKRRILEEIIRAHAGSNGDPYVLVLDKLTTFLLSTQFSMNDIMYPKEPICLVENVSKKRQPNPYMEAVYLLQPTAYSIKAMVADFTKETGTAQYGGIHIILTGKCPQAGIDLIKNTKRLVQHMITFTELNIDVFPTESNVINFGLPNSMNVLFGHGNEDPNKNQNVLEQYNLIADRMVSVCSTLNELPYVRIRSNNNRSKLFYDCFSNKMQTFITNNSNFKWHDGSDRTPNYNGIDQRATLLVLDRRDDLATVLRHEFSYQALTHDTLEKDIKSGLGQTSFEYSAVHGTNEIKMNLSDSKDPVWLKFRHENIIDVPGKLQTWHSAFQNTDAYKILMRVQNGDHPKEARKIMMLMRTKDETQKILSVIKNHQTVIELLMKDLTQRNGYDRLLLEINELETQIITGYEENNGSIKDISMNKIRTNMFDLLNKPEVPPSDKLRLILLWFVTFGGSTTRDAANQIFQACEPKLPSSMESIVPQLSWLNVAINSSSQSSTQLKAAKIERNRIHKRTQVLEKSNQSAIRILETKLKDVLTRHIDATLSSKTEYLWSDPVGVNTPLEFQEENGNAPDWYINQNSNTDSNNVTKTSSSPNKSTPLKTHKRGKSLGVRGNMSGGGRSLRSKKLGGGGGGSLKFGGGMNLGGAASSKTESHSDSKTKNENENVKIIKPIKGGRIILMLLGGATFAELKDAYDIMESTGREVLVCTTGMLTPIMFTEQIRKMARDDDSGLEEKEQ